MSTQIPKGPQAVQEWREDFANALDTYAPGSERERVLVRKIDWRIVPTIWILYTLSYLDRANIGNAKEGGMEQALHLTSTQYSIILLIFFVSYVIFEVPLNMMLTRVRPSIFLSALCFIWGGIAAAMGAVHSWQSLAGVRFALGVIEAGFAPGVAFYLSSWYKKHELARRFAIYYTATAVSGAFSGLLAGVITSHLDGARGIEGWRWLLIIEGVGSCFVACFTWKILPDWPATTSFLTEEEKFIAVQRLEWDGIGNTGNSSQTAPTHAEAAKMALTDWRTYILIVMYMLATGSQTIQYFIPQLVGQLGYSGYSKQYMTIPIYGVAFVCIVAFCFASDIMKERGNFITAASLLATVSFIICVAVDHGKAKYAFLCFGVGGVYAACPLTLLWVSNVIAQPAEKRAVAIALVNSLGNSASIYGSFLWPTNTGPRFVQGFACTTAFLFVLAILAQVLKVMLRRYPRPEDNLQGQLAKSGYESGETSKVSV
ncbi:MFS general substrate transporter [Dendrothele bispora CBS 962.96]|uniref:MFS general substrate transporter n=1 Tax=Dendrothele bispora (strain CBS 962.96) TaxID=1314807 RepID=A0A4S8LEL7_DENBC|nr:MFS general substrate transporter [Dendrothele bispora CBS 962.96]